MYTLVINEEVITESVLPETMTISDVLHLEVLTDFIDYEGIERKCGQNWSVHRDYNYLYYVDDENFCVKRTLFKKKYDKFFKVNRKVEDIWKITHEITSYYFASINERIIRRVVWRVIKDNEYINVSNVFNPKTNSNNIHKSNQLGKKRVAGEEWVIHGPTKYIPPIIIDVLQKGPDLEINNTSAVYILDHKTAKNNVLPWCIRSNLAETVESIRI
ncbi:hypothetical protein A3Q56_05028 [Intoshia linei]|uniref:Major vault protein repeat domain-containing protein n=1 Tax=Intoshia linei TaxID=1819745 RepID=A0A177B0T0_9BILA|nr:hypothetical protein A3Q56_05028 [Intoshia linei]